MAKIGSQNRLLIPKDLTNLLKIDGRVGIFWDNNEKKIYLDSLDNNQANFCICVRNLDNKNRICIPDNILSLIEADRTSKFVIAVKKHRIYIFKVDDAKEIGTL